MTTSILRAAVSCMVARASSRMGIALVAGLCLSLSGPAKACVACVDGTKPDRPSVLMQVAASDAVVLAAPTGEPHRFRVQRVAKGSVQEDVTITSADAGSLGALDRARPLLLVRNGLTRQWAVAGTLGTEHVGWLMRLSAVTKVIPSTRAEWARHVEQFQSDLRSTEPLIAQTAYFEIAKAPYATFVELRNRFDAGALLQLIQADGSANPRPLFTLLLGIAGGAPAEKFIGAELDKVDVERVPKEFLALVTAQLELCGFKCLDDVVARWSLVPGTAKEAAVATIVALRIHAEADPAAYQSAVISAYTRILNARPDLIGYIALECETLQAWDDWRPFAERLSTGNLAPQDEFVLLRYLRANPQQGARDALAQSESRFYQRARSR